MTRLGLISDTHGVLDERVAVAFAEVDRILHAGDICTPDVLFELEALGKPVQAVRGNCDRWESGGAELANLLRFQVEGVRFLLLHERTLGPGISHDGVDVVVFGHSHVPTITEIDGVLWVNPGSATQPRRGSQGRSVAILEVAEKSVVFAEIVFLDELTRG